jgi:hypothetical protein
MPTVFTKGWGSCKQQQPRSCVPGGESKMIPASKVVGHSAAKWSKAQPHEGIWWTNKLHRGVKGCDRSYIAYSPSKNRLVYVQQLWNPDEQKIEWLVGDTRQSFEDLDQAKGFVKDMLND